MITWIKPENQEDNFDGLGGFNRLIADILNPVSMTAQSNESSDKM